MFYLFVYICFAVGDPIKRERVGIPLTGLTMPHIFACPMPELGCPMSCHSVFNVQCVV